MKLVPPSLPRSSYVPSSFGFHVLHIYIYIYIYISFCIDLVPTVLYCAVLYCTVLHCTVLYCTVLYCTVLYCTVLYCIVQFYSSRSYIQPDDGCICIVETCSCFDIVIEAVYRLQPFFFSLCTST